jgi:hypothetical protein
VIASHVVTMVLLVATTPPAPKASARCGPGASIVDGHCVRRDFAELNNAFAAVSALPHDAEACRASKTTKLDE